jgi:hypothetical protein
MPSGSALQDLARVGELVRDAVVVAVCLAAVAVLVVLSIVAISHVVHAPPRRRHRARMRWRVRHTAARAFAAAVADGDLERAELMAGRALGSGYRTSRRSRPVVASWDERVVLDGTRPAAAQLRRYGGLVAWCPGVRRPSNATTELGVGDLLTVGRCHPLRLTVRSHQWVPTQGLRCSADAGGLTMVAQLTLRPILTAVAEERPARHGDAVEVWVHVEGPAGRQARRALRRLRRATRTGLRRWAAQRNRPLPGRGPNPFQRDAGAW